MDKTKKDDSYSTSSCDEDEPISWRGSAGRNTKKRFLGLHFSLKSTFDEYCEQFSDMEAELVRLKRENKTLAERNKKQEEELKRAKQLEESTKKLKEELEGAKEREESNKKILQQSRNKLRELSTAFGAMKEECDQMYNQHGEIPQVYKRRKYVLKAYEVNDLLNCPICLEPWTHSGEHIVCSLSCGHFFGKSCITRWISRNGRRSFSTCPVCTSTVTLSDIRRHYVSQIYDGALAHGD